MPDFINFLKEEKKKILVIFFYISLSSLLYYLFLSGLMNSLDLISSDKPKYLFFIYLISMILLLSIIRYICDGIIDKIIIEKIYLHKSQLFKKIGESSVDLIESRPMNDIITNYLREYDKLFILFKDAVNRLKLLLLIICAYFYLFFLSKFCFLLTSLMIFLVIFYIYFVKRKSALLYQQGIAFDTLAMGKFHQLVKGFREVKLNREKGYGILNNHIRPLLDKGSYYMILNNQGYSVYFYELIFFLLLGIVAFIYPQYVAVLDLRMIKSFTLLFLLIGWIFVIVDRIDLFFMSFDSLNSISGWKEKLENIAEDKISGGNLKIDYPFKTLTFKDISFKYPLYKNSEDDDDQFMLGPLNLEIYKGEVLFIIGENGSGKTTLAKLITGIYFPNKGNIYYNEYKIERNDYLEYRNMFAPIFSDFFLFKKLYGLEGVDEEKIVDMLDEMKLLGKTNYQDGKFDFMDLSTGQRKRLAMIEALSFDRQIYLFDEWASDQDPHFKDYFYYNIISSLKKNGKTVLAIVHDDRYFHLADRLVIFEYGKLKEIKDEGRAS